MWSRPSLKIKIRYVYRYSGMRFFTYIFRLCTNPRVLIRGIVQDRRQGENEDTEDVLVLVQYINDPRYVGEVPNLTKEV